MTESKNCPTNSQDDLVKSNDREEEWEEKMHHEAVMGFDDKGCKRFTYEEYDAFKDGANWAKDHFTTRIKELEERLGEALGVADTLLSPAKNYKALKLGFVTEEILEAERTLAKLKSREDSEGNITSENN